MRRAALIQVTLTAMLIAASAFAWMPAASGAVLPEAGKGQRLAAAWCVECHAIDGHGMHAGRTKAPSFRAIANMPSTTALSLKVFLRSSHPSMPNFIIESSDTDEIVQYILSLKRN
ncbi:mono/diheme cytochrome c family protein [Rhodopseudomonas rhenobacensis]|uniref:Mono/diheme cytochrome c family protein n=1 Tax=Rhodopseudomonas rhenobacensis TaxID=87461 RepID=A0A7W7Z0Z4_9BRAD|nr:cytochrome c [Rhodopseudomonas rhenobacensis]MBB5046015.1 mono/diheme cytochrome c family protein [Rhodopseudomonas rhenobacensis]